MLPARALAALDLLTRLGCIPVEHVSSTVTVLEVPNGTLVIVVLDGVLVGVVGVVVVGVVVMGVVVIVVGVVVVMVGVEVVVGVVMELLVLLLVMRELELATQMWFLLWLMPQMAMLWLVNRGRCSAPVLRPVSAGVPLRFILMHLLMLRLFRLVELNSSVRALT